MKRKIIMSIGFIVVWACFTISVFALSTVTTPINLSSAISDQSGDGWEWSQSTKTLILKDGFDMKITAAGEHDTVGILLPEDAIVDVKGQADISIDVNKTIEEGQPKEDVLGISSNNKLNITGTGTLNVTATNSGSGAVTGAVGVEGNDGRLTVSKDFTGEMNLIGDLFGMTANSKIEIQGGRVFAKTTAEDSISPIWSNGHIEFKDCDVEVSHKYSGGEMTAAIMGYSGLVIDNSSVKAYCEDPNGNASALQTNETMTIQNKSVVNVFDSDCGIQGKYVFVSDSKVLANGNLYGIKCVQGCSITNSTVEASEKSGYITANAINCGGQLDIRGSVVKAKANGEMSAGIFVSDDSSANPAKLIVSDSRVEASGTHAGIVLYTDEKTIPVTLNSDLKVIKGGKLYSLDTGDDTKWMYNTKQIMTEEENGSLYVLIDKAGQSDNTHTSLNTPDTGDNSNIAIYAVALGVAVISLVAMVVKGRRRNKNLI
ncbi:MAG: LPXTG cell wall anchor domain-containing protein [Clostridiales bacterium]|nr:LPXTG cell wall anchor domain-containing protein [Clostridiales bacterium]